MASSFLKGMAARAAGRADEQRGYGSYGGSGWRQGRAVEDPAQPQLLPTRESAPQGLASPFLQGVAGRSRGRIDTSYGPTAFGGSTPTKPQTEERTGTRYSFADIARIAGMQDVKLPDRLLALAREGTQEAAPKIEVDAVSGAAPSVKPGTGRTYTPPAKVPMGEYRAEVAARRAQGDYGPYSDLDGPAYESLYGSKPYYGKGNINLARRPLVQDGDAVATVRSTSFQDEDGKETLIPTVIPKDGRWQIVSDEEAIAHYRETGEYLGKFDTAQAAEAYARQLRQDQERAMLADYEKYGAGGPPSAEAIAAKLKELERKQNAILQGASAGAGWYIPDNIGEYITKAQAMQPEIDALREAWDEAKARETEELHTLGWRDATAWDLLVKSAKRGYLNAQYGMESYKDMMGWDNSAGEYAEKLDSDEFRYITDGWWQDAIAGAAELGGQGIRQATDPRALGYGTAAAGAAGVAGQLGPQVLLPEEIITMPTAFVAGWSAGNAQANFEIEAGLAYRELTENGVSPDKAQLVATIVGGVNAALEGLQVDELLDSARILQKSAATQGAAGRVLDYLEHYAVGVGNETLQEVLQEGSTIAGAQVGQKWETGEWAYSSDEVADRLKDTAISSAMSFGVAGIPGAVRNMGHIATEGKTNAEIGASLRGMDEGAIQAVIDEGLQSAQDTDSYRMAQALRQKQDEGRRVTNEELGILYKANVEAVAHEEAVERVNEPRPEHSQEPMAQEAGPMDAGVDGGRTATGESAGPRVERTERARTETAPQAAQRQTGQTTSQAETDRTTPRQAESATITQGLGKYGSSAYQTVRAQQREAGTTDERGVWQGFSRYYDAGAVGLTFEQAHSEYGRSLTEEQRISAYVAGRNDAAATLKERREAAQFATVQGEKTGFIPNEYSKGLSKADAKTLNDLGKALGVKIQMVDTIQGGRANGEIRDGVISIARDAANPVLEVVRHEVTHELSTLAPQAYKAFRDYAVRALMEHNETGVDLVGAKLEQYAQAGVELTREGAMDEIAADLAGKLLTDREAIRRLVRDNRTVAGKFREALRRVVEKVKGVFQSKGKRQAEQAAQEHSGLSMAELNEAARLWDDALKAASAQAQDNKKSAPGQKASGGAVRYSLGGYDQHQRQNWAASKRIVVYEDEAQLRQFIQDALDKKNLGQKIYFGTISHGLAQRIQADTGVNVEGYNCSLSAYEIRKILLYSHGNEQAEGLRGQRAITVDDILSIPDIITAPDNITLNGQYEGRPVIQFEKNIDGRTTVVSYASQKHHDLTVQTMFAGKKKGSLSTPPGGINPLPLTSKTPSGTASTDSISQTDGESKYSLKGGDALELEVARLSELNEYLRDQLKVSKVPRTDAKAIQSLASAILAEYSSGYDAAALSAELQALYDFMASGKAKDGTELSWGPLKERAVETARHILDEAEVLNDDNYHEYKGLRHQLRETGITIPKSAYNDLPGGFHEFHKHTIGRLNLVNSGTPIDVFYQQLTETYGETLFPGEITHPADMAAQMAEVYGDLMPVYENPFSEEMDVAAEYLADDLIERFYETPQKAPTFADRQAAKLDEAKAQGRRRVAELRAEKNARMEEIRRQGRERVQQVLRQERERRETKAEKVREHYRGKEAATRERRGASELRAKIRRQFERLSRRLLNPTETSHIPEELRGSLADFMGTVDLSSDRMGEKTLERLLELQKTYRKIAEGKAETGITMEIDPDLQDMMDSLAETLKRKRVGDMNRSELETLYRVVRVIGKTVTDYNRTFNEKLNATISSLGISAMLENGKREGYRENPFGLLQKVGDLINMDMVAPADYFEELGPTMGRLYGALRDGFDVKVRNTATAADYMTGLLGGADISQWTGKKARAKTFHCTHGDIELTPAQVMSLYLLFRQEQGQGHIFAGGIKAAPVVTVKDGKGHIKVPTVTKSFEVLNVTLEDVAEIVSSLTDEQVRIAEGISDFFVNTTAAWGNEVSMRLYGYKKFTVERYFPIVSDRNYITQVYGETTDATLKNMGSTKARTPHANNPVIIEDAFDVYTRQADKMGSYNAFVVPLTDLQRVWNYRAKKGGGSVKQSVEKHLGRRALNYFAKFVTDVNGGMRSEQGSAILNAAISRYKAARVGLNVRVVVQQPTAYLRAAAMISPANLTKGLTMKADWEKVKKYAPIAQWKDWGYFNLDTGRQMKDIFIGKEHMSDKIMWAAGKADEVTWARLWNACELETAQKHPELRRGTEAFYRETGRLFSEMIDRTQVVDSTFHRPQIMRSGDALVKMSTAFMSEPMKSYNLLRTAARNAKVKGTVAARKQLARAIAAFVATAVVNNIVTGFMDAWRGGGGGDEDKEFSELWLENFLSNMAGEVPSMFPIVKDVFSLLQGYDVKRMDMQGLADLIAAAQRAMNDKYTPGFKLADLVSKTADLFGVPASSVRRELEALAGNVIGLVGNPRLAYEKEKLFYSISSSDNKGRFYNILFDAWLQEDKGDYEAIAADMVAHGFEADKIEQAMRARLKKREDFVEQAEAVRADVAADLEGSRVYQGLSPEYRDKAMEAAGDYANVSVMLEQDPEYELPSTYQWVGKAQEGERVGLEPWEYILFKTALQKANEDGSITQEDVIAAIDSVPGLTGREKDYLFGTRYQSDKNNPWK